MGFHDRLKRARKSLGLRQGVVEARCGWRSQGRLSNYERGVRSPKLADILILAKALAVRPEWLLTGEEPRHTHEAVVSDPDGTRISEEFMVIPYYSPVASAGLGGEVYEERSARCLAFRREWLMKEGFPLGRLSLVRVEGDTMEPTLTDGDVLLVNQREKEVIDGRIYVMRLDMKLYVKRLQIVPGGRMLIKSDNRNIENVILDEHSIDKAEIIGRVVWVGKRV
ncbi:MAG: helix-turn-helix transcriptional regulator [Magnetococcales bacterium]|nr:helix-turn-helix transcriptional regulator [Magnetococcales bacterium]